MFCQFSWHLCFWPIKMTSDIINQSYNITPWLQKQTHMHTSQWVQLVAELWVDTARLTAHHRHTPHTALIEYGEGCPCCFLPDDNGCSCNADPYRCWNALLERVGEGVDRFVCLVLAEKTNLSDCAIEDEETNICQVCSTVQLVKILADLNFLVENHWDFPS